MAITVDGVSGMPTIAGTRIGVHHVVEQVLHGSESVESVATDIYPHLSEEQVIEAIEWSFEHSAKYSRLIKEHEQEKRRLQDVAIGGPDDLPADF
jgi:uncharacterized protein (DUF433 family)